MAVKSQQSSTKTANIALNDEIGDIGTVLDRKKLLEITSSLITETSDRVSGDRFRVRDGDKERLAYIRLLKELLTLHAALLKDAKAPLLIGYEGAAARYDTLIQRL